MIFLSNFYTCLFSKLFQNRIPRRLFMSNEKIIRVRFAPSPTGLLHLGGLRTALFNYFFAKSQKGVTVLRIEDTDQTRIVETASEALIKDLNWCGLTFDEGPYYQSERIEIYKQYANQLLEDNKAYYCFCNKTRLDLLRKQALKAREIPKYDNKCRFLSKTETNERLKCGEVPCIRFKLSQLDNPINDLILNPLKYDVEVFEGDPVILKADGFPTYHFANIVDDHLMNITHVLRGAEWHISTAKHILLYKALNWEPPAYGHMPLLLNFDGSKMSKRQGDYHIQGLREKGYFPNAILNFIIKFSGGFNISPKEKSEQIFTIDELCEKFDISRLKSYSSKISLKDLDDYNNMEITRLIEKENEIPFLVKKVQQILTQYIQQSGKEKNINLSSDHITLILKRMKNRINRLEELTSNNFLCFWFWNNTTTIKEKKDIIALKEFLVELKEIQWTKDNLKVFVKNFVVKYNLSSAKFLKLLRMILIECQEGPSVVEILEILGKEVVYYRIKSAIEKSNS